MGLFSDLFGGGKRQGGSEQQGNAPSDETGNWVSLQVLVDDIADTIRKNQLDLDWIAVDFDMSPRYIDAYLNIHEIGARPGDNMFYRFRDHGFATPSDPRALAQALAQRLDLKMKPMYKESGWNHYGVTNYELSGYALCSAKGARMREEEQNRLRKC